MRERAPSRKRTSAWTTEVGWTTTSIRSYGRPKRKCASISSSPLFASVAESTVIFGPMFQVGCASASSGVTSCRSSALRPRNGPAGGREHERIDRLGARPSRHWKAAECSLSTGSSRPPPRLHAASASSPAATRLSLFASASVDAALERPERRRQAREADDGVQDEVRLRARRAARSRSPPTCVSGARPSIGCEPDAAAHSSSPGCAVDDLERLPADRAGRAEQGDPLHRKCTAGTVSS